MHKEPPLISVLLPVFNAEKYLGAAISSILNQTYSSFELLAINDGSTDGSLAILQAYRASDSRIKIISRENRGLIATLNEGIQLAKGEIIARMDADDIAMPDRLELQLEALNKHPEIICVGGQVELIDESDRKIGLLKQPLTHQKIENAHLNGHTSICHPAAIFYKAAVVDVGGYCSRFPSAEDFDLWLRLGERGELANIPNMAIQYRLHSNSVSEKNQHEQLESIHSALKEAYNRRGLFFDIEEKKPWRQDNNSKASQLQFSAKYAWLAWSNGNYETFRHYAKRAIKIRPISITSLKLIYVYLFRSIE
jgi:glycosyltransferase involved in cell wall biosynthesis